MSTDHYKLLQVDEEATVEVIEAAYRRLARMHHPDVSASRDANDMMRRLIEARGVLVDPEQRKAYDRSRKDRGTSSQKPGSSGVVDWSFVEVLVKDASRASPKTLRDRVEYYRELGSNQERWDASRQQGSHSRISMATYAAIAVELAKIVPKVTIKVPQPLHDRLQEGAEASGFTFEAYLERLQLLLDKTSEQANSGNTLAAKLLADIGLHLKRVWRK